MNYIVIDTETTGLARPRVAFNAPCAITDNGSEVIQIGGLYLDEQLKPAKAFCYYCDCMSPESSAQAFATHQIAMSAIRERLAGVFLEEVVEKHLPELLSDDVTFMGYNSDFDMYMIRNSMRSHARQFAPWQKVTSRLRSSGRWAVDAMAYLPKRVKLSSFYQELTPARERFHSIYGGSLPLETNYPELLLGQMKTAHNSLYDAIETYLLLQSKVFGKSLFRGR